MDERDKEIEKHIYGAKMLMEYLWDHVSIEFPDADDTAHFISVLLDDITAFYKTHTCEDCAPEEKPSKPGVVLPFPLIQEKDRTEN